MELNVVKPTRKYESVIILHPDATEKEQKEFFKKQKDILKKFKGQFNHVDCWGKRRLANPIKKLKVGTYFHTTFEADAESVAELERVMRIEDKVLRFTHTRLDDRVSLGQHVEDFREVIKSSINKENEKEKAFQARRAAKQRK
ncbi:MAG: 30S ribosomal protein S6 [Bdellovibrionales bacterium]|nr:30S ribosomal protein S6 [Bdellovibrionales bacterium]